MLNKSYRINRNFLLSKLFLLLALIVTHSRLQIIRQATIVIFRNEKSTFQCDAKASTKREEISIDD